MYTIAAFYHFTRFDDPEALRAPLLDICRRNGIRGTLLLAREGINGTIAGSRNAIDAALGFVRGMPGCSALVWKESTAETAPFHRLKVRLKKEIVTLGQPDVNPVAAVGRYVEPANWNALIAADDVVVIDTRNDYEVAIGTFDGAIDPGTASFGEFPAWWAAHGADFAGKRVAMFCTGGIRCEKSTNYLLGLGVEDVFHLRGGILKYLEEVPEVDSRWQGDCFVFDARVSVGHGLAEGPHALCYACRMPILPADKARPQYEPGVSCHLCADQTSPAAKERFRERQKQVALSAARGEKHIGPAI